MTWRFKVQGVVVAIVVLTALALSAGAAWTDLGFFDWAW
jgi:hypothetical protein